MSSNTKRIFILSDKDGDAIMSSPQEEQLTTTEEPVFDDMEEIFEHVDTLDKKKRREQKKLLLEKKLRYHELMTERIAAKLRDFDIEVEVDEVSAEIATLEKQLQK